MGDNTGSAWRRRAACAGQGELFFDDACTDAAKTICAACPVREECLEHALRLPERYGVWGGATVEERRGIRRRRNPGRAGEW